MKINRKNYGLTLTELIVVVAVVALLIGIAIPAVKSFNNAINNSVSVNSMISAALSSARATAAKHQKYAGIRFQQDKDGNQYMIAIIHDPEATNLAMGFISVKGLSPVKLPESIMVFSTEYRTGGASDPNVSDDIENLNYSDGSNDLKNISTFTILFSPAGNLARQQVRVRNRDGKTDNSSEDSVFNTDNNVNNATNPVGKFVQDDSPPVYGAELSTNRFIVINNEEFKKIDAVDRWDDYLEDPANNNEPDPDKTFYINPYTGCIIGE